MDREYYNLERRENDHKTTFKKSANANGYKKIDIEKDDFGQASEEDPDDDVSGADFTYKIHKQCDIDKKVAELSPDDRTIYKMYYVDGFRQAEIAEELGSGVRNIVKYSKVYSGTTPEFIDGDVFKTKIFFEWNKS